MADHHYTCRPDLEWSDEAQRDVALIRALIKVHGTPWPAECKLNPNELRLIEAASHGLENSAIAELYGIPFETVKSDLRGAYRKLAAKNRTHAVAKALRQGLVT